MNSPRFPLAAVIGSPISHSRSPVMHRYWLSQQQVAGDYTKLDVRADDLRDVLKTLPKMGFVGVNITIPHKQAALELADQVTDRAARIGAANTLVFKDGLIFADNTDGYGFIQNLKTGAPDWNSSLPAVVLGAGGAARAVIVSLLDEGVPTLRLMNRSKAKAEALAQEFGTRVEVRDWDDRSQTLNGAGLLVNTTSLGMVGQPELAIDLNTLPSEAIVTDLVYTPLMTDLLARAQARGNVIVDGLGMLLHQGVPGFEMWFGATPTVDTATRKAVLG